ncbi:glutathione S-transferase family protein [Hahella sp. KA22]|uniref:glutathione S-transferase family protein n=1 Tax=Hahella sp. KA22 TaxID=1628392 RepID=UPI000FDDF037|nr:glutathione S-transferase family protein [Hahella sp. KA22]AZZ95083.1 glutathione S-transferase family protein [Hahella sp. KA22]QAY52728.1 glutathione S-transferase family protein [Hahella sp. KA22]
MQTELTLVIGNKNYSSWSLRAWLPLKRSGLAFSEVFVPLMTPGYKEKLLEYSPAGKVPALLLDGRPIWDSLAIAEWVAEQKPEFWPRDSLDRAWARAVTAEMHSGFPGVRGAMPMNCRASGRRVELDEATREEVARICEIWTQCREAFANRGPWLFGEWSIADAFYAPVTSRFRTYGVEVNAVCAGYIETTWSDSLMQEWLTHAQQETQVIEKGEVG